MTDTNSISDKVQRSAQSSPIPHRFRDYTGTEMLGSTVRQEFRSITSATLAPQSSEAPQSASADATAG